MENKYRGIDEIIRQAMDGGAFENLRGKGKPLNLEENPYLDKEWQLAYHLLKQNGFAPDFVEKRQAIEMQLAEARQSLIRTWAWRTNAINDNQDKDWVESEWGKAIAKFEERIAEINTSIKNYNISIPMPSLYKKPVILAEELGLFTN
jgi:DnaJ homolog subfamily C member 28